MITRLFIIALFLALPIVIALLSQRMADTVAPPNLPASPLEISLSTERTVRRPGASESPSAGDDAPVTPRVIQRAPSSGATEAPAAVRTPGSVSSDKTGKKDTVGGAS